MKNIEYRFIEFFVFDYDSLPYLLSLFIWLGDTFPLAALDKIPLCLNCNDKRYCIMMVTGNIIGVIKR